MIHQPLTGTLTVPEKSILRTLLYFDIFQYPLTEDEIISYAPEEMRQCPDSLLTSLTAQKFIHNMDGYYALRADRLMISRRLAGNRLAEEKMKKARSFSAFISHFPFVRSVMLSGSISKGYMDEKSDIDYFIITAAGRLWIVRTALVLFRRIFLFNSRRFFCTNYFIDSENLEIEQKNIFTAIEASTLKPMFGKKYVYRFQDANRWCHKFLPNFEPKNGLEEEKDSFFKKMGESMLSGKWLDPLDRWLMKVFAAHWKKRYHDVLNDEDFSVAFQSRVNVSRSHPEFYQKKVLNLYAQKLREFEKRHNLNLES